MRLRDYNDKLSKLLRLLNRRLLHAKFYLDIVKVSYESYLGLAYKKYSKFASLPHEKVINSGKSKKKFQEIFFV